MTKGHCEELEKKVFFTIMSSIGTTAGLGIRGTPVNKYLQFDASFK